MNFIDANKYMTYKKSSSMRYVDIAIYFDKHIHDEHRDDNKLFQYCYFLCYMLACKRQAFKDIHDYDSFALFAATRIYMRCINPNREPVKSVLNLIRNELGFIKIDYQKFTFPVNYDYELSKHENADVNYLNKLYDSVRNDYYDGLDSAIIESIEHLDNIFDKVFDLKYFNKDKVMMKNIKVSCILTLLNQFTLNIETINKYTKKNTIINTDILIELFRKERKHSPLLWHLDNSMGPFIAFLCNKLRHEIVLDLQETKQGFELEDSEIEHILASNYDSKVDDGKDNYGY